MKKFLIFLLLGFIATTHAEISQQAGKILIQNVQKPELYVFCNPTSSSIILDRVDFDNPGVQAGWSSLLPPRLCSVFMTDKGPFTFACRQEAMGAFNTVDCQNVLLASLLPWSGQVLNQNIITAGSAWALESAPPDELLILLRHKGFDS